LWDFRRFYGASLFAFTAVSRSASAIRSWGPSGFLLSRAADPVQLNSTQLSVAALRLDFRHSGRIVT